nr:MAG TPA: hypothetical protein [Caudoviricetes sp.]
MYLASELYSNGKSNQICLLGRSTANGTDINKTC